jgi:hypothetical protein
MRGEYLRITRFVAQGRVSEQRFIPVHPSPVQEGFIRFVQAAKDEGQARLFPALRPNKYGRLTAKWGNGSFR